MRVPAEWEPHRACWLAWPANAYAGEAQLLAARDTIAAFAEMLVTRGDEPVALLVEDEAAEREARARLARLGDAVRCHRLPYGDLWLRDTGPVFGRDDAGLTAVHPRFNGWGGRYLYPGDAELGARIAGVAGAPVRALDLVAEGGALEFDGEGTCLTTRSCLLNPNRNPDLDEAAVTARLRETFAVEQVLWLDAGLAHDHTDGHIDNAARFVAPGVVVHARADQADDPQREALAAIEAGLASMRDARGRALERLVLPSPGLVRGDDGEPRPASYLNFVIANRAVIVPAFDVPADAEARGVLARAFPGRDVVSVNALALLEEGGTLHCASCNQPGDVPQSAAT